MIEFLTSGAWVEALFGGIWWAPAWPSPTWCSAVIVTLVLTLYFLASLPSIKETIYQLAPASRRPRVKYLAGEMFRRIGGYMSGLFTIVLLATGSARSSCSTSSGSASSRWRCRSSWRCSRSSRWSARSSTSMLIVSLVAFSNNTTTGIITLVFFLLYQQVDAYLLQPRIFSKSVNVPGPLIVLAAISGGILLGIVGALLAIPTVASLLLLYREVLVPAPRPSLRRPTPAQNRRSSALSSPRRAS